MIIQKLLGDIDLKKTKFIRHNITNEEVSRNLALGYLDVYQSIQLPSKFKGGEHVLSFLGTDGTNGVFQGCFKIKG